MAKKSLVLRISFSLRGGLPFQGIAVVSIVWPPADEQRCAMSPLPHSVMACSCSLASAGFYRLKSGPCCARSCRGFMIPYPLGEGLELAPLASFLPVEGGDDGACRCWLKAEIPRRELHDLSGGLFPHLLRALMARPWKENYIPATLALWRYQPAKPVQLHVQ